jgi:hypothetical protein
MPEKKFMARLKLKGHKVQSYSIEGLRFLRGKGWKGISPQIATVLRKATQDPHDDNTALLFDVFTPEQVAAERKQARAAEAVQDPADMEIELARSDAPQLGELAIDDYGTLNAKNTIRKVERGKFAADELEDLLAFERSHKDRVTVKRALKAALEELE